MFDTWRERPEVVLWEKGDWRVRQEYGPTGGFYGILPWWGVGRSPVVIQHIHGTKWETASQWILPETSEPYPVTDEWAKVTFWHEHGVWRDDCRVCGVPFPEEVMSVFNFFRELGYE